MKTGTRKAWKSTIGSSLIAEGSVPLDIEEDPYRLAVIEAYKSPTQAKELLQSLLTAYWDYKKSNYTFPISSLEPNVIPTKKPVSAKSLLEFIPEVQLDHLFQSISDYLDGEKLDVAFGLNEREGRPSSADELAVAKFFHKRLPDGYESAANATSKEFNLSESRVKRIHSEYRNIPHFDKVVEHDLKFIKVMGFNVIQFPEN